MLSRLQADLIGARWTCRHTQGRGVWRPAAAAAAAAAAPSPPVPRSLPLLPQKEIRDIERDKASGVTIEVQGNSLQKLIGRLNGAMEVEGAGWDSVHSLIAFRGKLAAVVPIGDGEIVAMTAHAP